MHAYGKTYRLWQIIFQTLVIVLFNEEYYTSIIVIVNASVIINP